MTSSSGSDHIDSKLRYDLMVEEALRDVVRLALLEIEETGLPGEHHFYITFYTQAPGVVIPEALKKRYPDEMTIVLQHQYWDLKITDTYFAIGLQFSGVFSNLVVPFSSIIGFSDPSVQFGLQFTRPSSTTEVEAELEDYLEKEKEKGLQHIQLLSSLEDDQLPFASSITKKADDETDPDTVDKGSADDKTEKDGASDTNIVTLDNFRKKNS